MFIFAFFMSLGFGLGASQSADNHNIVAACVEGIICLAFLFAGYKMWMNDSK